MGNGNMEPPFGGVAYTTLLFLLTLVALASAQIVRYNITTNNTVVVEMKPMVISFGNTTVVTVYPLNETHAKIVYTCIYVNSTNECHIVDIVFSSGFSWLIDRFDNCTVYIVTKQRFGVPVEVEELRGICMMTNITTYNPRGDEVRVADLTEGITYVFKIFIPPAPKVPLDVLNYLIPAALLVAFALRGNAQDVAIGLIFFAFILPLLPWIGINLPFWHVVFVTATILGIVILMLSRT